MDSNGACFVGVDLGQASDPTALTVVERVETAGAWDPVMVARRKVVRLQVRYLERVPLGTAYPDIVERVREMTQSVGLAGRCRVVADATGVGRPVMDLLRRADLGCVLMPVVVTSGDMETQDGGYYRVPKRDLIVGLQVLLQQEKLKIAAGLRYSEALAEEMAGMRVRTTQTGHEQFGAWREGQHDDLVFAVALACWGAGKLWPGSGPEYMQFRL
jgi:hypothetical protein